MEIFKKMKLNESKYKLVVNYVQDGIRSGRLDIGDWIPSINAFRQQFNISRDTVFAGISELKSKGIIESHQGKGYFINSTHFDTDHNIFVLFNEFNEFKKDLYNSFIESLPVGISVDTQFHNYNRQVFESLLTEARHKYTTYVIMTGKFLGTEELLCSLGGRVFLLDHFDQELRGKFSSVSQDFEQDTYDTLNQGVDLLRKYKCFIMVQNEAKEPYERFYGLKRFCKENNFEYKYLNKISNRRINVGDVYVLVSDRDLVTVIKQANRQELVLGKDFGIISYNDTPLKEVLCGGITTMSTDFKKMGHTMAELINNPAIQVIHNPAVLNIRSSI